VRHRLHRHGFNESAKVGEELVAALRALGPNRVVDVDYACICQAVDTIGRFGFHHDFGACK
jgi:hypothetical protein